MPTPARIVKRGSRWGVVGLILAAQVGLLVLAAGITVWGPVFADEPELEVRVAPPLVSRKLEIEVAVAAFQQAAGPPVSRDLITTESLLPDLPTVLPGPPPEPDATASPVYADPAGLFGDGWAAAVPGGEGSGESVSLLGLEDKAERIVVAFDVSASVLRKAEAAGVPMTAIRDQAGELIDGLSPAVLFGLVQFSRAYDRFQPHLLPGTRANREAARSWLATRFVTDGRSGRNWTRGRPDGVVSVLGEVFAWEPDVIFIISDASFEFTAEGGGDGEVAWPELRSRVLAWLAASGRQPRVHLIAFRPRPEDAEGARDLTAATGGRYREW